MSTNKVGMSCDMRVIAQVLGQRTYRNDVLQVAVKELLQNGFDACKPNKAGRVDIVLGQGTNPMSNESGTYVKVIDNGIGMTTETVVNVYLRMGGTLKEGLSNDEKSGGFGIAKIQYLTQSEAVEIKSWRDDIETSIITNAEQLFSNETEVNTQATEHPNGTEVTVWYPKSMDINWPFNYYPDHFGLDKPNLGYPDIEVWYKSNYHDTVQVCLMDESIYTAKMELDFSWGKVDVHYAPQQYKATNSGRGTWVLSAGTYQFTNDFRDKNSSGIKFDSIINIHPKVDAHAIEYPINNSREGFSPSVYKDVEVIQKYLFDIQRALNSELVRQTYANMSKLSYISVDGKTCEKSQIRPTKQPKLSDDFLLALRAAFEKCDTIYETKPIVKETVALEAAEKSEVTAKDNLQFNNRTNGDYAGCETVFSKIASAIADIFAETEDETIKGLHCGIIIRKGIGGTFLKGDMLSLFVNPLVETSDGNVWVDCMLETVCHELGHIKTEYHGESHNQAMRDYRSMLIRKGLLSKLEGKFRSIYNQHYDDLVNASIIFSKSTNI